MKPFYKLLTLASTSLIIVFAYIESGSLAVTVISLVVVVAAGLGLLRSNANPVILFAMALLIIPGSILWSAYSPDLGIAPVDCRTNGRRSSILELNPPDPYYCLPLTESQKNRKTHAQIAVLSVPAIELLLSGFVINSIAKNRLRKLPSK